MHNQKAFACPERSEGERSVAKQRVTLDLPRHHHPSDLCGIEHLPHFRLEPQLPALLNYGPVAHAKATESAGLGDHLLLELEGHQMAPIVVKHEKPERHRPNKLLTGLLDREGGLDSGRNNLTLLLWDGFDHRSNHAGGGVVAVGNFISGDDRGADLPTGGSMSWAMRISRANLFLFATQRGHRPRGP